MQRPTMTPLEGRPQVDTRINQPSLEVTARPVATVANTTQASDNALAQFVQNMRGFTGEFDRFAQVQQKATIEQEQEKALMDSIQSEGEKPVLDSSQSAWYQKESMKLFGKASAAKALTELQQKMNELKDDPESLRNLDPASFMDDWAKTHLAGIDDPDVASEVYPTIQKTIPSVVGQLGDLKRTQLDKDIKEQKKQAEDNAYNYASQTLGGLGENFTAEDMWKVHEVLTPMVGEKAAAGVLVQIAKAAVDGGGLLAGSEVLKSKNPRNGWTIDAYLGDDKEARNAVNGLHKFVEETRIRKQKEAEDEQRAMQTEARADSMRIIDAKVEAGQMLSPSEWASLTPGESAERQVKLAKAMAPIIRQKSVVEAMNTVGADNLRGATTSEKQEVWDSYVDTKVNQPVNPSDPKGLGQWSIGFRTVLLRHSDGNRSMSLKTTFQDIDGVEKLPAPMDANGVISPQVLKAKAAYDLMSKEPSLRGYLKEFSPETREYLRLVSRLEGSQGLQQALNHAKTFVEPGNIEARNAFIKDNRVSIDKAVNSELDEDYIGSSVGPLLKDLVAQQMPGWLEVNALTERDPKTLAKMFVSDFRKEVIQVQDPTIQRGWYNPSGWGGNDEKRPFLRPGDVAGLSDGELGEALTTTEKYLSESLKKDHGDGVYSLRPMPGNRDRLVLYKDGRPMPMDPVPWKMVTDYYKRNATARTWSTKFSSAAPVKDLKAAETEAKGLIDRLVVKSDEGAAQSQQMQSRPTVTIPSKDSKQLPMGVSLPETIVPAKPSKAKTSVKDRYVETNKELPPLIPPLPPELKAKLPAGIQLQLPPKQ